MKCIDLDTFEGNGKKKKKEEIRKLDIGDIKELLLITVRYEHVILSIRYKEVSFYRYIQIVAKERYV